MFVPFTGRTENRIKKRMQKKERLVTYGKPNHLEQDNYFVVWPISHFKEISSGNLSTIMTIFSNRRLNLVAQMVSPFCGNQLLNVIK